MSVVVGACSGRLNEMYSPFIPRLQQYQIILARNGPNSIRRRSAVCSPLITSSPGDGDLCGHSAIVHRLVSSKATKHSSHCRQRRMLSLGCTPGALTLLPTSSMWRTTHVGGSVMLFSSAPLTCTHSSFSSCSRTHERLKRDPRMIGANPSLERKRRAVEYQHLKRAVRRGAICARRFVLWGLPTKASQRINMDLNHMRVEGREMLVVQVSRMI